MIEKHFTYADLPKKGIPSDVQFLLTDKIILEYLNKVVENSNLLVNVDYKEQATMDSYTAVSITFNLLKADKK